MNRTLQYGEGLFETIYWKGENRKLKLHYERLKNSAEFFGYPYPSYEEFVEIIGKETKGKREVYVKFLLLFKGNDYFSELPDSYEIKVIVKELKSINEPVSLCISPYRRHSENPIFRHKTTNFLFNILVKRDAIKKGYFDAVVLNESENITETSSSNILIYKNGKFYTPHPESGLLYGTTIKLIEKSLNIKKEFIDLKILEKAQYVFLINSLHALPVKKIEDKEYKVSEELLKEIKEEIERKEKD